jgi:hypothetical protein
VIDRDLARAPCEVRRGYHRPVLAAKAPTTASKSSSSTQSFFHWRHSRLPSMVSGALVSDVVFARVSAVLGEMQRSVSCA